MTTTSQPILFVLLLPLVVALQVVQPDVVAGVYESPLFNFDVGPQLSGPTNIMGKLVKSLIADACNQNRTEVEGNIVYLYNDGKNLDLISAERQALACVETFGAVAAIRGQKNTLVPGMWFRFNDGKGRTGDIPIVTVAAEKFQFVADAIDTENVIVDFIVDNNRWVDMWDSTEFLIVFRIFCTSVNAFGAIFACFVLYFHACRITKARKAANTTTAKFMMVAVCIEFCAFVLRAVYCGIGPLFSTTKVSIATHIIMLNITNPLEATAMLFAASLFLRFGGLESITEKTQRKWANRLFVVLSIISFVLQYSLTTVQVQIPNRAIFFTVINLGYQFVLTLTSSFVFLYQGRSFLRRLNPSREGQPISSARRSSIQKAVKWIMVGGAMQFTQIASIVIAVHSPSRFFTPTWFMASYALFYFGLSFAALANTSAFKPIHEGTLTSTVSILKRTISKRVPSFNALKKTRMSLPSSKSRYIKGGNKATSPQNEVDDDDQQPLDQLREEEEDFDKDDGATHCARGESESQGLVKDNDDEERADAACGDDAAGDDGEAGGDDAGDDDDDGEDGKDGDGGDGATSGVIDTATHEEAERDLEAGETAASP